MCYHVAVQSGVQALSRRYQAASKGLPTWKGSAHVVGFSHPFLPFVFQRGERVLEMARWGLIPPWQDPERGETKEAALGLNARLETASEKAWFRTSLGQRGILPVDAFFEWQHRGRGKQAFRIQAREGTLSLACLVQEHPNLVTFAVLTRAASPEMALIHNNGERMPWMLPSSAIEAWINPNTPWAEAHNLPVLPDSEWSSYPVLGKGESPESWSKAIFPPSNTLF